MCRYNHMDKYVLMGRHLSCQWVRPSWCMGILEFIILFTLPLIKSAPETDWEWPRVKGLEVKPFSFEPPIWIWSKMVINKSYCYLIWAWWPVWNGLVTQAHPGGHSWSFAELNNLKKMERNWFHKYSPALLRLLFSYMEKYKTLVFHMPSL